MTKVEIIEYMVKAKKSGLTEEYNQLKTLLNEAEDVAFFDDDIPVDTDINPDVKDEIADDVTFDDEMQGNAEDIVEKIYPKYSKYFTKKEVMKIVEDTLNEIEGNININADENTNV